MQHAYAYGGGPPWSAAPVSGAGRCSASHSVHRKHGQLPDDRIALGDSSGCGPGLRVRAGIIQGACQAPRHVRAQRHLDRRRTLADCVRSPGTVALLAEGRTLDPGGAPASDYHRPQCLADPGGYHLGCERRDRQRAPAARLPVCSRNMEWLRRGFYLRSRSACVPLVVGVGRRSAVVRVGVGRRCG